MSCGPGWPLMHSVVELLSSRLYLLTLGLQMLGRPCTELPPGLGICMSGDCVRLQVNTQFHKTALVVKDTFSRITI